MTPVILLAIVVLAVVGIALCAAYGIETLRLSRIRRDKWSRYLDDLYYRRTIKKDARKSL